MLFDTPRGAAAIVARVRTELGRRYGEQPVVVLRTATELERLLAAQPFAACGATPTDKLYVTFLARKPRRRADAAARLACRAVDDLRRAAAATCCS